MSDERCIRKEHIIEGVPYEIWVDRYRNISLVFGGHTQDADQFTEQQWKDVGRLVDELLAPDR